MLSFVPEFTEVLSLDGWVEINTLNLNKDVFLQSFSDGKTYVSKVIGINKYLYNGPLLEIKTETCTLYLKPTSYICADSLVTKAENLKKGDLINRYHTGHLIESITQGIWQGFLYNLTTDIDHFIFNKFENDYYLIR